MEPSIREGTDGLLFTEEGYLAAKETLKAEYGQDSEIVNAYYQKYHELTRDFWNESKENRRFLQTVEIPYTKTRHNGQSCRRERKL